MSTVSGISKLFQILKIMKNLWVCFVKKKKNMTTKVLFRSWVPAFSVSMKRKFLREEYIAEHGADLPHFIIHLG